MFCQCPLCLEPAPCHQFCAHCSHALLSSNLLCQQCCEPSSQRFCKHCIDHFAPWERLSVVGPFIEPWSILIKQLKYQHKLTLVQPMAHLMAERILSHRKTMVQTTWRITAMPMHSQRLNKRGYNQAACLAQALSRALKLPYLQPLWRKYHTQPLTHLNRAQRHQTIAQAFACTPIQGSWLLVDDVFTTGASMMAASQTLRQAGASRIWLATLAKTPN